MRALFAKALTLAPGERERFLDQEQLSPETRRELNALLEADLASETFLSGIVGRAEIRVRHAGERFGPFETRELVGVGGMGAVFRAERVDGELSQVVAIKVVERLFLDPRSAERFRRERELLARLEHPNVARLLDGGTRSDGVAYLVMEFVDGLPLDRYSERHDLSVEQKLRLFLPLCDAVDYAHQKLIIHRDLKPSNVLVTAAGVPKLLDFGIARSLESGDSSEARTQTVAMTPEFASPEQLCGGEATTRTDVYGLGAVLYFLLTGRVPHAGRSLRGLSQAVSEAAPAKPSSFRSDLKGDLDNIVLKALHPDPGRRYPGVRELAEDVGRFLSHHPVRATPDRWTYRATRFIARHRFACAAAAATGIAIVAGTSVSLYEWHRAAERTAQVRRLANGFVFDFEAAIRDTPGTLAARRMVAATAREYLANLAQDSGRDRNLQRELAESYFRLSRIETQAGESEDAIAHRRQAIQLLKNLHDDCCGPEPQRADFIQWSSDLARTLLDTRSIEEAQSMSEAALANARDWYPGAKDQLLAGKALVAALSVAGNVHFTSGNISGARPILAEAVEQGDQLLQRRPTDDESAFLRARAGQWYAAALSAQGDYRGARKVQESSQVILDRLLAREPNNTTWRALRARMATSTSNQYRYLAAQDPSLKPKALDAARDAYTLAIANARQNPDDKSSLDEAVVMTTRYATQLARENRRDLSMPLLHEAGVLTDRLAATDPSSRRNLYLQMNNRVLLGAVANDAGDPQAGLRYDTEAEQMADRLLARWPTDLDIVDNKTMILMNQAIALRHLKRVEQARVPLRKALDLAAMLIARKSGSKNPVTDLEELRYQAHILGLPDVTQAVPIH